MALVAGGGGASGGAGSKQLRVQDLGKLDVTQLNPLSPEVISRQATINIGAHAPVEKKERDTLGLTTGCLCARVRACALASRDTLR
jgi:hypothetical protein